MKKKEIEKLSCYKCKIENAVFITIKARWQQNISDLFQLRNFCSFIYLNFVHKMTTNCWKVWTCFLYIHSIQFILILHSFFCVLCLLIKNALDSFSHSAENYKWFRLCVIDRNNINYIKQQFEKTTQNLTTKQHSLSFLISFYLCFLENK